MSKVPLSISNVEILCAEELMAPRTDRILGRELMAPKPIEFGLVFDQLGYPRRGRGVWSRKPFSDSGVVGLISQKAKMKLFCRSQFPHRPVDLSFIVTHIQNKVTDLCGN